jgi:hypothetical protein
MKRPEGRNPQLNVYPTSITPASAMLACLSGAAWVLALAISITDVTSSNVLAVSIGVGATTAVCAVALDCTVRIVRKLEDHACRVEKSTAAHAEMLAQHILTLDRFFEMGIHSDRLARTNAADFQPWNARGTGPFRMYNGDAG